MDRCTNVQELAAVGDQPLCLVTINGNTEAYWFYPYADAIKFLDQDVIVEYRKDVLNGQLCQFIKTFTIPTIVKTLEKTDTVKLFLDQADNQSNLSFNEIGMDETKSSCIVYCISQEYRSSPKAKWMELKIRDRMMKIGFLRIFDYESIEAELAGKYIITNLTRNKFGFQSDFAVVANESEASINSEVVIARQFIENIFSDDAEAQSYLSRYNLLDCMEKIDDYEPGYAIVRLAMELAMVDAMVNITNDFDIKAVKHSLLCSYGYMTRNSKLSDRFNNLVMAQNIKWPALATVLLTLDEKNDNSPFEQSIYNQVRALVDNIIRKRKEVDYA